MLADVLEAEGKAVADSLAAAGVQAVFQRLDVALEDEWRAAIDLTLARFGRLDVVVNNAGISGGVPDRLSTEYYDRLMAVNARGTFLGVKHGIEAMKRSGGGSVINISSMSGLIGQEYVHMGYNASKGATRTLTKAAAVQFGPDNIRVNSIHPGIMPPMRTSITSADPATRAKAIAAVPLRRAGRVEEVAYAALFFASDEASYITGAELVVDGGYCAA
jgi:NAD(P)-dependent dehydrogenase (short-subunit alcohol dehydrogenase family)